MHREAGLVVSRYGAAVALALPLWTLFVWLARVRNVVRDDGVGVGVLVPLGLCVLAGWALADRRRGVRVLAAATVAVWAVRLPLVLAHDHAGAFKAVHAALAVVSVALAFLSLRAVAKPPAFSSRAR